MIYPTPQNLLIGVAMLLTGGQVITSVPAFSDRVGNERVMAQAPTFQPVAPPARNIPLPPDRQRQEQQPFPLDHRISALQPSSDKHLWVGSWQGLAKIDPRTGRIYGRVPLPNATIGALAEDRMGRIWIGSAEGLVRVDPHTGKITAQNFALPSNRVLSLLVDRRGYLWVGTDAGLVLVSPDQGLIMTTLRSLPGVSANALSLDAAGNLWVGTLEGLVQVNTANALLMRRIGGLPGTTVQTLATRYQLIQVPNPRAVQKPTQPAVAHRSGNRHQPRQGKPAKPQKPTKPAEQPFITIVKSTLWVGTTSGLVEIDTETGRVLQTPPGIQGRNITSLQMDRTERLWVGSSNGLWRLNVTNGAVEGEVAANLPSRQIVSLAADSGGKLWVGTSEGLAWVSMQTFRVGGHDTFQR
jgi:ligand-binding sensor domain-containing protein